VDDADEHIVNELGLSLREMEVNGNYFGEWSMTAILYDPDRTALDRSVANASRSSPPKMPPSSRNATIC